MVKSMKKYKTAAAVYLRKSRADNAAESVDETLARHCKILTDYAVKNDITITAVYKEVVSGDGLFTRPEMIRLLQDVEAGLYTSVLCVDIDRLGRSSAKDSGIIMETLKDAGCIIITPEKTYNLENDVDEMTVELKTFFARQELKSIAKRLRRGMTESMKQGAHVGDIPYGYRRAYIGKTPTLEPIEPQAGVVKMIYDWYTNDNIGSCQIENKLRAMGYSGPNGGRFSRTTVRAILKNPVYKGQIVWNRKHVVKKRKPGDAWRVKENDESKWVVAKGLHKPLVSEEQWDEVQRIMSYRQIKTRYTGEIKNPLHGLIYCANCGLAITRQYNKKYNEDRMLCTTKGCNRSVKLTELEDAIKQQLKRLLYDLTLREGEPPKPKLDRLGAQKASIEKQLSTIKNQRSKLHDLLEQGVYSVETFMERQKELTERETAAENEIKALKKKLTAAATQTGTDFIPTIRTILSEWDYMTPEQKNEMLSQIITRMTYRRTGTKLHEPFELNIEWNI